jgi:hypothetical protein
MQKEVRKTRNHRHGAIIAFHFAIRTSANNMLRYNKAHSRYIII